MAYTIREQAFLAYGTLEFTGIRAHFVPLGLVGTEEEMFAKAVQRDKVLRLGHQRGIVIQPFTGTLPTVKAEYDRQLMHLKHYGDCLVRGVY